jgi:hypothetical protein
MSLLQQLSAKKAAISAKWFDVVAASYPADTARFLKGNQDSFANPVGQNSRQRLDTLIDLILTGFDAKKASAALDFIVRARAIQDFTPARAIRFVFDLKGILRDQFNEPVGDAQWHKERAVIEDRIDKLAMLAFDLYMACREKIYEIKANEVRSRTFSAFARAGLIKEPSEDS